MEPKFQSSFIPKKPLPVKSAAGSSSRRRRSFNLLGFISAIIFIIALGLGIAAFGYERVLENRVNKLGVDLRDEKEKLDLSGIGEYKELAERLNAAQMLVSRHKAVSGFFTLLSQKTLHNISYETFSITDALDGTNLRISVKAKAATHNAFTVQSDVFKTLESTQEEGDLILKNILYSEIGKNDDGTVSFTMAANVDANEFLVKKEEESDE